MSMRWLAGTALTGAVACGGGSRPPALTYAAVAPPADPVIATPTPRQPAPVLEPAAFTSRACGYSVVFPRAATEEVRDDASAPDKVIRVAEVRDGESYYYAGCKRLPYEYEDMAKTIFDTLVANQRRMANVSGEKDVEVDGHPGREITVDAPMTIRYFIVGSRLIQLMVAASSAKREAFFQSLKIVK